MEHHSNIVPWQMVAAKNKCKLKFVGIDQNGRLDIDDFKSKITTKTRATATAKTDDGEHKESSKNDCKSEKNGK